MPFMRGFPLWRFVFQLCNSGLALPGSLEPPAPSTNSRCAVNAVSHSECLPPPYFKFPQDNTTTKAREVWFLPPTSKGA